MWEISSWARVERRSIGLGRGRRRCSPDGPTRLYTLASAVDGPLVVKWPDGSCAVWLSRSHSRASVQVDAVIAIDTTKQLDVGKRTVSAVEVDCARIGTRLQFNCPSKLLQEGSRRPGPT